MRISDWSSDVCSSDLYRYCWLRDAYFVVHALNRLGATKTMEGYLTYISNVVSANLDATSEGGHLQPVFGISLESRLDESACESLSGYRGMGDRQSVV